MIRPAKKSDIKQMLAIEGQAHFAPWSASVFELCMQAPYYTLVAQVQQQIVGFTAYSIIEHDCHILNLCVDPHFRRSGWGKKLLEAALISACDQGAFLSYLEVRPDNKAAIALYAKQGFKQTGRRKQYYLTPKGREDALLFSKILHDKKAQHC